MLHSILNNVLNKNQCKDFYIGVTIALAFIFSYFFGYYVGHFLDFLNLGDHRLFDFSKTDVSSAYIQGVFTFLTGIFVLIAGFWAYHVTSIKKPKSHEEQENAKRKAYRLMMSLIIEKLFERAGRLLDNKSAEDEPSSKKKKGKEGSGKIQSLQELLIPIPAEIKPENWERHAFLKGNEIEDIFKLHRKLEKYQNFQDMMKKNLIDAKDRSAEKSEDSYVNISHLQVQTRIEYLEHAKGLNTILQRLNESLKEP